MRCSGRELQHRLQCHCAKTRMFAAFCRQQFGLSLVEAAHLLRTLAVAQGAAAGASDVGAPLHFVILRKAATGKPPALLKRRAKSMSLAESEPRLRGEVGFSHQLRRLACEQPYGIPFFQMVFVGSLGQYMNYPSRVDTFGTTPRICGTIGFVCRNDPEAVHAGHHSAAEAQAEGALQGAEHRTDPIKVDLHAPTRRKARARVRKTVSDGQGGEPTVHVLVPGCVSDVEGPLLRRLRQVVFRLAPPAAFAQLPHENHRGVRAQQSIAVGRYLEPRVFLRQHPCEAMDQRVLVAAIGEFHDALPPRSRRERDGSGQLGHGPRRPVERWIAEPVLQQRSHVAPNNVVSPVSGLNAATGHLPGLGLQLRALPGDVPLFGERDVPQESPIQGLVDPLPFVAASSGNAVVFVCTLITSAWAPVPGWRAHFWPCDRARAAIPVVVRMHERSVLRPIADRDRRARPPWTSAGEELLDQCRIPTFIETP
mmetsp:Transcript_66986/g.187034  ORF Transcript_66986/g.187034 Transcript_66986/m.187034 type:complete len:481 (-) Transcript_66986:506-1948(-)